MVCFNEASRQASQEREQAPAKRVDHQACYQERQIGRQAHPQEADREKDGTDPGENKVRKLRPEPIPGIEVDNGQNYDAEEEGKTRADGYECRGVCQCYIITGRDVLEHHISIVEKHMNVESGDNQEYSDV